MLVEDKQQAEQAEVEQQALDKYNESQAKIAGSTDGTPEGFNDDGTPIVEQELILGKFKSQEDLVNAYAELEKKQSESPTEQPKETPKETPTTETETPKTTDTFNKYVEEYATDGAISEKSYGELKALGLSKNDVDNYIEGQKAVATDFSNTIFELTGGKEAYKELIEWAVDGVDSETREEYNKALQAGNTRKVTQLIEYMHMKKGSVVTRVNGTATSDGVGTMKAFTDKGEWFKATGNSLYGKDAKYTTMVDKRYLASKQKGTI